MRRFGRRTFLLVPAISSVLVLMAAPANSSGALTSTTLGCNDGTLLSLTLNPSQLLDLKSATNAMSLYPTGLSCGLLGMSSTSAKQKASPATTTASGGQSDFAVGGGQAPSLGVCPGGVALNFGMSAHVASNTLTQGVGGTFNVTAPNTNGCQGHLVSKVDCLRVIGNRADFTSFVTQADGNLAFLNATEIATAVLDSTSNGTQDMIDDTVAGAGPCDFRAAPDQSLVRGNIDVNDAG